MLDIDMYAFVTVSCETILTFAVAYGPYVFHPLYYLPAADDHCHKEAGPYVLSREYYRLMGRYHGGMLVFALLIRKQ